VSFNMHLKLRQDVTIWTVTPNGYGGWTFDVPVLVKGRWEDRNDVFMGRVSGKEEVSRAAIFLDQDVDVDDWLALGDYTATCDPTTLQQVAYPVRQFINVPDLRNLVRVRKALI